MKKTLNALMGIIFVLAILLGCSGGGGGGGSNPTGPGGQGDYVNFGGTVTYNGTPMDGAAVYLIKPENAFDAGVAKATSALKASILAVSSTYESFGDYRTVTNSTGGFSFSGVAVGNYTLIAVKGSHQVVKTGLSVNGSITTVDVALSPTGNLNGNVAIPGEADISGVIVYLEGTSFVSITDSTGLFRFLNVPAGNYSIRARRDVFILTNAVPVSVVAAADTPVPTLSLTAVTPPVTSVPTATTTTTTPPPATTTTTATPTTPAPTPVFGTVTGSATKAGQSTSSGILIHLQGTEFVTVTNSVGSYTLSYVPPGTYTVYFYSNGYNDGTPQPITVPSTGGTVAVPAVTLSSQFPSASIVGTLAPIGGIFVSGNIHLFQQGAAKPIKITQIGLNGSFEFTGLTAGNYYVQLAPSTGYAINQPFAYFPLANGQKITQANLPVIVLVPNSVISNRISFQLQQDKISVSWDGVADVSSYTVFLFANGNAVNEIASKSQVYGSQIDFARPSGAISSLKAGIITHANGADSTMVLNPTWIKAYLDIANPQVVDTGYSIAGFKDTIVGNGNLYYLATDAANCYINKVDLSTFALTSGPSFTPDADMFGAAGSTGVYAIVAEANLNMYKFGFDLTAHPSNPVTVAAGAMVDPRAFQAPDGMLYAFWLQPGGSPLVRYASGPDFNTLGAPQTEAQYTVPTNITGVTAVRTFDNQILYVVSATDVGTDKLVVQAQTQTSGYPIRKIETFKSNIFLLHNYLSQNSISRRSPLTPSASELMISVRERPIDFVIDPLGRFWVLSKSVTTPPFYLYLQVYSPTGELLKEITHPVQTNATGNSLAGRKLLHYDSTTKQIILALPSSTGTLKVYTFDATPVYH